jgi:hypothetical protein
MHHPLDARYNSVVVDEPQLIIVDLKTGKLEGSSYSSFKA